MQKLPKYPNAIDASLAAMAPTDGNIPDYLYPAGLCRLRAEFMRHAAMGALTKVRNTLLIFVDAPSWRDDNSASALHHAVADASICEYLINKGTDIDHQDILGHTALHLAAYEGHGETVLLLLDHGANTHLKNKLGKTAQEMAQENRQALTARQIEVEERARCLRQTQEINAAQEHDTMPFSLSGTHHHAQQLPRKHKKNVI